MRFSRPAPYLKRLGFALTRGMIKSLGRLSDGIRLGSNRGFSSGEMLDYVYANQLDFRDGKLTGEVKGEIIDGQAKARLLRELAAREGVLLEQVIAVGESQSAGRLVTWVNALGPAYGLFDGYIIHSRRLEEYLEN